MMYRRMLRSYAAPLVAALVLLSTVSVSTVQAQDHLSWRQKAANILDEPIFARVPYLRNIPFLGNPLKIPDFLQNDFGETDVPEVSEEKPQPLNLALTFSGALTCAALAALIKYNHSGGEHIKGALIASGIGLAKDGIRAQNTQERVEALSCTSRRLSATFLAEATRAYWLGGAEATSARGIARFILVTLAADIGINALMTIPWTIGYKCAEWRDRHNNPQKDALATPAPVRFSAQQMQQVLNKKNKQAAAAA